VRRGRGALRISSARSAARIVRLLCLAALSCLFSAGRLSGAGKNEVPAAAPPKNEWSVTAPAASLPGDCAVVVFRAKGSLHGSAVKLSAAGTSDADGTVSIEVAILGLSTLLEPGIYLLEATALIEGAEINSVTPLTLESRAFISEKIALDSRNTAIKTDFGPERMAQIKALNELLFFQDSSARRFAGLFREPLISSRRTSSFGDRRTYTYRSGKTETSIHYGVDYGVPDGTPVFSSGDGKVVMAEKRISTGWTVVIEHLPGVYSLYYHLEALLTAQGEYVRAGTLVGRSGSTGLATGPHLHWEFRVNGEAVSPDFMVGRTLY
jgi:murein DD-endopeptidase MepM/ murein hydrolase activator NlpD